MVKQPELPVRKVGDHRPEARLSPGYVQGERAGPQDVAAVVASRPTELNADARDELVKGEWLREVVACAKPETAQLGLQVRAGRHNHDGQPGPPALDLPKHTEAVNARQEQVEDDEIAWVVECPFQSLGPVCGGAHQETLGLQAPCEERQNPRLVLDDEDAHSAAGTINAMTRK